MSLQRNITNSAVYLGFTGHFSIFKAFEVWSQCFIGLVSMQLFSVEKALLYINRHKSRLGQKHNKMNADIALCLLDV